MNAALPSALVSVGGVQRRVLVDTGYSRNIAHVSCCKQWSMDTISIITVNGEEWQCEGTGLVRLQLGGGAAADVRVCVTATRPLGYTFILGMDSIKALEGVTVDAQGEVRFNSDRSEMCAAADTVMGVDKRDFYATYDPEANYWTAAWKWAENKEPGILQNRVEAYSV